MELTYKTVCHCDKCGDLGLVNVVVDGRDMVRYCECDAKRKTLLALKRSGLEDSVARFRFDNFDTGQDYQKRMLELCRGFAAQRERRFLYIGGQSGCGKTHLGTAVCAELMNRGLRTIYTTFQLLMNELKRRVNEDDYAQALGRYGGVPVLYIDDFMKFEPSKADIAHSFELINLRVIKNAFTVITSERSLDEITGIDEALGGRIKQQCGEFAMDVARAPGRNWRLR